MNDRKSSTGNSTVEAPAIASLKADLEEVMGDFCDAFVFIETAVKALDADSDRTFPELPVLQHGMRVVEAAYDKLDRIVLNLQQH
jgi:hypothetical protein